MSRLCSTASPLLPQTHKAMLDQLLPPQPEEFGAINVEGQQERQQGDAEGESGEEEADVQVRRHGRAQPAGGERRQPVVRASLELLGAKRPPQVKPEPGAAEEGMEVDSEGAAAEAGEEGQEAPAQPTRSRERPVCAPVAAWFRRRGAGAACRLPRPCPLPQLRKWGGTALWRSCRRWWPRWSWRWALPRRSLGACRR